MFEILLIALVFVHLDLERRIWIQRSSDIFVKYRDDKLEPLVAAKWAYLAKAVWLITLILFQYFGLGFRESVVFSFSIYAILIQILLPFKIYNLLNLLLAIACLIEWWIKRA